MKTTQASALDIEALRLDKGAHDSAAHGMCIMEAVSMLAGEGWSDHPVCASPVISAFLRSWNDRLGDDERQELKQYIPLLVGSAASPAIEQQRSYMLRDWVVRECTPIWLRRAGMHAQADILAGMAPITSYSDYVSVAPAIRAIREETWPKRLALRATLKAIVLERLKSRSWAAAAAAVAADAAVAAAVAVAADAAAAAAAAVAAAAAAVAADAAAVAADAAAVAAAADAADAADAVAADAAYDDDDSSYWAYRKKFREAFSTAIRLKLNVTANESRISAHGLVARLLALKD